MLARGARRSRASEHGTPRRVQPARAAIGAPGAAAAARHAAGRRGSCASLPRGPATIVDGSAAALAGLAAFGALPRERALRYAADCRRPSCAAPPRSGAEIVDQRLQPPPRDPAVAAARRPRGRRSPPTPTIPRDGAVLNPFADRGTDAQTVAVYDGARGAARAVLAAVRQFPEHRPFAAFDGDPATWWSAERNFDDDRRWIEIDFGRRIDVADARAAAAARGAHRPDARSRSPGGAIRSAAAGTGCRSACADVDRLRIAIAGVEGPPTTRTRGPGAIAEIRVPGVQVREPLRPPVVATRALAGEDLRHARAQLPFERTTGDDPFQRRARIDPDSTSVPSGDNQSAALVAAAGDGETSIARRFELPAARRWRADGWVTVAPGAARGRRARYGAAAAGSTFPAARSRARVVRRAAGARAPTPARRCRRGDWARGRLPAPVRADAAAGRQRRGRARRTPAARPAVRRRRRAAGRRRRRLTTGDRSAARRPAAPALAGARSACPHRRRPAACSIPATTAAASATASASP